MRRNSQASPIKEKRVKRFSPPDFLSRFRAMRRNPHASPIKEKRVSVFQLQTSYKIASSGRSRCIRAPLTTVFLLCKNTQPFYQDTTRPPCRTLNEAKLSVQQSPSVSNHKACRKRRALCPHKEVQSAFMTLPTRYCIKAVRDFAE